jgi:autophagy-related protein 18
MLFCTSLVAYVGAGEQPALTPRKLTVVNTCSEVAIQHISFVSRRGQLGGHRAA